MYTRAETVVPVGIVVNAVRAVAVLPTVAFAGTTVDASSALGNAYTALDGIVNAHGRPDFGVNVTLSSDFNGTATFALTVYLSTSTTLETTVWNTSAAIVKSVSLWNPSPRVDVNVNVTLDALPTTSV